MCSAGRSSEGVTPGVNIYTQVPVVRCTGFFYLNIKNKQKNNSAHKTLDMSSTHGSS